MGSAEVHLGIDLAWSHRARTGLAAVGQSGALLDSCSVVTDAQIDAWLGRPGWRPVTVAIDAPIVVVNETGARDCEKAISRDFGRYWASCHPANRSRPWFDPPRAWLLAQRHGWRIDPPHRGSAAAPAAFETFPHPAMVVLFGLDRIITYKAKRGRTVAMRRAAFAELFAGMQGILELRLPASPRWDELVAALARAQRQVDLDVIEDEIDAILCAHVAWLRHSDPPALAEYGDARTGCIIVPAQER